MLVLLVYKLKDKLLNNLQYWDRYYSQRREVIVVKILQEGIAKRNRQILYLILIMKYHNQDLCKVLIQLWGIRIREDC